MGVAAYPQSVDVSTITGIHGGGGDGAFLKKYEPLGGLECGARGICALEGSVIKRLQTVFDQRLIVASAFRSHKERRVVGGRRHHAQYFAGGRFDGYNCSDFSLHQLLSIFLKIHVDA